MPRDERRIPDAERSLGTPDRSAEGNRSAGEADRGVQRFAQLGPGQRRPSPSQTTAPAGRRKTTDRLLITDATESVLRTIAPRYVQQYWRLSEQQARTVIVLVKSWDELVAKLNEYDSIGHLVLMFHGVPGDLLVGIDHKGLREAAGSFKEHRPHIRQIDLEGCTVAKDPEALVGFGKVFGASQVTGWNHYWAVDIETNVVIPRGMTSGEKAQLQKKLDEYQPYFVQTPPTAEKLAAKPGKYILGLEWFSSDESGDDDDLPPKEPGSPDRRERTHKPRRNATRRLIRGEQEARDLRTEYAKSFTGDNPPFHQVVVNF
jgi:hypothetical protein